MSPRVPLGVFLIVCVGCGEPDADTASAEVTDTGSAETETLTDPTDDTSPPDDSEVSPEDRDGDGFGVESDCDDANSGIYPGAVDVCGDGVDQNCTGADAACALKLTGAASGDRAGRSVAGIGDVNGDGYEDIAVGAHQDSTAANSGGAVSVFFGPVVSSAALSEAHAAMVGESIQGYLGASVDGAGDVNGDGYDDLIVGAFGEDASALGFYEGGGAAYLIHGGPTFSGSLTPAAQVTVEHYDVWLGHAVIGSGDNDGDGFADVLIGAPGYAESGAALWLAGPVTWRGALDEAALELHTSGWIEPGQDARLGHALAALGDVDGDGLDDVLIGEPARADKETTGAASLYLGPLTDRPSAEAVFYGVSVDGRAGEIVGAAGDADGDGSADLLIGAGGANEAFLVTTWSPGEQSLTEAAATFEGDAADELGLALAGADHDGDGASDVLIGAPGMASSGRGAGGVLVFYGPLAGTLTPEHAGVLLEPDAEGVRLGSSLDVGDLNRDGLLDVISGAPGDATGGEAAGAAFLFLGELP